MPARDDPCTEEKPATRHILALSGGKDSSALAVYLKGKVENMEYAFCDTEEELEETYEYLLKLEVFLGAKIHRLKYAKGYGFDDVLDMKGGFLPSPDIRWCTEYLKLKPYEEYVGDDPVISYVGIRADERHRVGYISTKPNVKTVFPFVDDNIRRDDVMRILDESGLGLPAYYGWRSRSGCYFCFFQQKREWVGLLEHHKALYKKAMAYEKVDPETGERFTWSEGESLEELAKPERVAKIKAEYEKRREREANAFKGHQKLKDVWLEDDDEIPPCTVCHI